MAGIEVQAIAKSFGGHQALKQVSLSVADQEFVVLLGPSGCGKTTLLRIIAGLESQTSGRVLIGGRDVSDLPPRKRRLAMVFQNYAVFPHLSVFENIAFGLRLQKLEAGEIKRRVIAAAETMHIEMLLERYPGAMSGGQRQRVAVARALAVEPEVLLMDEPLSNLDALLRLEMRAELKGLLQRSRTTTIYVTHDQVEAMSLADRIAVMHGGRIVQYDRPMAVYQQPANRFVGGFIGNPPMNFIPVRAEEGRVRLGSAELSGPIGSGERLLGIRPEDLEPAEQGIPAEVAIVEPLGPHLLVTARIEGHPVRVTVPTDLALRPGDHIHLKARAERVCWLDAATEESLA